MKSEYCKYSSCIKEGLSEYLKCSKLSDYCKYQRYCTTKKKVVHTDDIEKCSILRAEEESKMANKKQNRKEKKVDDSASKIEVEKVTEKGTVVLATPNYYIVAINGSNVKIISKNNYKKGDIVKI